MKNARVSNTPAASAFAFERSARFSTKSKSSGLWLRISFNTGADAAESSLQ